jgi:hypothetical protein
MRNEDDDDALQHDWRKFSGMENEKFDDYVSVDSRLVTSGVNTVEELCESHVGATLLEGAKEEGEDTEPEVVPNSAKVHEALMKVKSFVYVHSNSDGDCDSVLSLESSLFELKTQSFYKTTVNYRVFFFFRRISSFKEELYHVIANKYKSLNFSYL